MLQVENMSSEWQYLFEKAGVTQDMLADKNTLQFILDTVHQIGGPQKLTTISGKENNKQTNRKQQTNIQTDQLKYRRRQ